MAYGDSSRVLYDVTFDGTGHTDQNSLHRARQSRPDKINPVITHLAGRENKKFPLQFLTEGQSGGTRYIELKDIQYEWDVFRKLRKADKVVSTAYTTGDKPGLNNQPFKVIFETDWIKQQHNIVSPNGYWARVQGRPTEIIGVGYEYTLVGIDPPRTSFCDPDLHLYAGAKWSMVGGANVSESFSRGNESNVVMPGKMKNQIGILRKSYNLGGNISNKVVEFQFAKGGKRSNLWIDFELWQHEMNWRQDIEENLWESRYNRLPSGEIPLKDPETGLPIPMGAGVIQQITNEDTYFQLTADKLKNTVGDVMYGATDTGKMQVVLYTGKGGMREFDRAMKDEASGFQQVAGDKYITGQGRNLVLTGYFQTYEHVDGHTITVAHLPMLDLGGRAENAPLHPESNFPLTSYEMYFLDQSYYDGELNVRMVTEKGRSMIQGVVQGMAKLPNVNFKGNGTTMQQLATDQDASSVQYMCAKGVCIRRNDHCFKLLPDVSAFA